MAKLGWVLTQTSTTPLPYNLDVPYRITPIFYAPSAPPLETIAKK